MPYTLSHPLAVVPLRRWCPDRLNFAALVIGSMSPDFGYFVNQFPIAGYAHSIPGTFLICIPTGLAVLGLFYLFRRPVCYILPEPHRDALTRMAMVHRPFSVRELLVATISVLLGAWTHTFWDSFTHYYGWPVRHIGCLHSPVVQIGDRQILGYSMLQHLSTIVGGAGLVLLYFLWLRRQPRVRTADAGDSDRWRYVVLVAVVLSSATIAVAAALWKTLVLEGQISLHRFVFWIAVYSVCAFFPLLSVVASVVFSRYRPSANETSLDDSR